MTGPARETGKTTGSGSWPRALSVKKLPATLPTAASAPKDSTRRPVFAPVASRKSQSAAAPAEKVRKRKNHRLMAPSLAAAAALAATVQKRMAGAMVVREMERAMTVERI